MKPKKKDNWLSCDVYDFKGIDDPNELERLSNDPFFVKKREEAQRRIDKYGIPKEFLEQKK